jgi:hypothetical protein
MISIIVSRPNLEPGKPANRLLGTNCVTLRLAVLTVLEAAQPPQLRQCQPLRIRRQEFLFLLGLHRWTSNDEAQEEAQQ